MPMVMAALHPTGEVGLVGSAELPQPDSIAANATHTGIRIKIRNLPFLDDHPTESPTQCQSVNGSAGLSALRGREPVASEPTG
jgi:hypothetical protein